MDKDDKKFTLQMVNDWVRFCDSKAGTMITFQGVILTIIFTLTDPPAPRCEPSFIFFLLGLIIFGVSIITGLNAILPRLNVGAPTSKIFFGHIRSFDKVDEYLAEAKDVIYDFEDDLLTQIWANSRVAWQKYELVRTGLLWGVIGFVLIGISYILK
jgi:hypothetical protein